MCSLSHHRDPTWKSLRFFILLCHRHLFYVRLSVLLVGESCVARQSKRNRADVSPSSVLLVEEWFKTRIRSFYLPVNKSVGIIVFVSRAVNWNSMKDLDDNLWCSLINVRLRGICQKHNYTRSGRTDE